jgi:large subunit ribosomal protein L11
LTPPATDLLRKAAGIKKGSSTPARAKAGTVTREQLQEIAKQKMPDLNAISMEGAEKIIAGTARSMGLEVVD